MRVRVSTLLPFLLSSSGVLFLQARTASSSNNVNGEFVTEITPVEYHARRFTFMTKMDSHSIAIFRSNDMECVL